MALRKIRHALMAAVALVVIGGGVDSKASADPAADLQENLKSRHEMLLKAFNQRMVQWRAREVMLNPLKDDLRALVKVSAELYTTKKERVAGLDECVKLAKELVRVTEAQAVAGVGTEADGLEVKVLLLDIQAELLREQNKPAHARDLNSLTKENYDKIKQGATTYKEVVELLGEPDSTNRPLARGEWLQTVWVVGSKRINVAFDNDVVRLKGATGIPGVAR